MFYLINVATDFMLFFFGEEALENKDIICARTNYVLVENAVGALYMLFHTLTILLYSLFMLHIFYRLPLKYNIISYKKKGKDLSVATAGERLDVSGSMAN